MQRIIFIHFFFVLTSDGQVKKNETKHTKKIKELEV